MAYLHVRLGVGHLAGCSRRLLRRRDVNSPVVKATKRQPYIILLDHPSGSWRSVTSRCRHGVDHVVVDSTRTGVGLF